MPLTISFVPFKIAPFVLTVKPSRLVMRVFTRVSSVIRKWQQSVTGLKPSIFCLSLANVRWWAGKRIRSEERRVGKECRGCGWEGEGDKSVAKQGEGGRRSETRKKQWTG